MDLYPMHFRLDGMTQSYVWGGSKLQALVPGHDPARPLAEIWVVSDRPEDDRISRVANGALAGTSLHDLIERYGGDLLGDAKAVDGKFPLLVKLLDAKQSLSLQVHPPQGVAAELGGSPKTECWLLLDGTDPGATVTAGFATPTTKDGLAAAAADGSIESLVSTRPVKAGEAFFIPVGRLHGIGAGCLILEIQENSNTTYRMYDWQRVDPATKQPRELHIQEALRAVDLADVAPQPAVPIPIGAHGERLVSCPQFVLERWRLATNEVAHQPDRSFDLIVCLTGSLVLTTKTGQYPLAPLAPVLVPACTQTYSLHGTGTYGRIFVPPRV